MDMRLKIYAYCHVPVFPLHSMVTQGINYEPFPCLNSQRSMAGMLLGVGDGSRIKNPRPGTIFLALGLRAAAIFSLEADTQGCLSLTM